MIVVTSETIANKRIIRTLGMVRGNTWYLKNTTGPGAADVAFSFGRAGDRFLAYRA